MHITSIVSVADALLLVPLLGTLTRHTTPCDLQPTANSVTRGACWACPRARSMVVASEWTYPASLPHAMSSAARWLVALVVRMDLHLQL